MSTPPKTVLVSRDINVSPTKVSPAKGSESLCAANEEKVSDIGEKGLGDRQEKGKGSKGIPLSMEQHRQALRARLDAEKYVSFFLLFSFPPPMEKLFIFYSKNWLRTLAKKKRMADSLIASIPLSDILPS